MSILTVSHEIGAGGPEIGQKVADQLGLHYVDQELISDAALRYGVLEEKLSSLDESKPSLFERFDAETRRYITVLQTAVFEFAEQDRVVLMGRAGQWLLRGVPHVLRLRVMAPFDLRVKRLAKKLSGQMGEQTNPRTVQDMARRDDQEKLSRMRYLYEVDVRDPSLYDLVFNTDKLSIDAAVEMIVGTLQRHPAAAGARHDAGRPAARHGPCPGLPHPGGARHQSRDAEVPHHGRGQEWSRDSRGHGGDGRGGGRGARGPGCTRGEDAAGGYTADPPLRRLSGG
jgi:cytidylate kinase